MEEAAADSIQMWGTGGFALSHSVAHCDDFAFSKYIILPNLPKLCWLALHKGPFLQTAHQKLKPKALIASGYFINSEDGMECNKTGSIHVAASACCLNSYLEPQPPHT